MRIQSHRKKVACFIVAAAIITIAAAIIVGYGFYLKQLATNPSPHPNQHNALLANDTREQLPEIDWQHWLAVNPDIVGWIYLPNTPINYPVVQAPDYDRDYYLSHDVYRNWNIWGCPYIDADLAQAPLDAKQIIIYGHHMNDKTMFSAISSFVDKDFAESHQNVYFFTPSFTYEFTVDFVRVVSGEIPDKQIFFPSQTHFENWYHITKNQAIVRLAQQENTQTPEQVLSLVTCSYYRYGNERTIVYAT